MHISRSQYTPYNHYTNNALPLYSPPQAANIGIEQSQQIVVSNDSGLPIQYEWVWLEAPQVSTKYICCILKRLFLYVDGVCLDNRRSIIKP